MTATTEPTLRERLTEYATAQRLTCEGASEVKRLTDLKAGHETAESHDLGVVIGLLERVVDDLDKILRGEPLEVFVTEVRV